MRWIEKEACGAEYFFWIIACLLLKFFYATGVLLVLNSFESNPLSGGDEEIVDVAFASPFFFSFSLFLEELIFRYPVGILASCRTKLSVVIAFAVLSSLAFGMIHGSIYNIFIQGVMGFFLCILFLKCGGLHRKLSKALFATTTVHILYDWGLIGLMTLGA